MKENWTNQMKSKLDGHKMTPPAGLWEGISNEMGLESAPAPKPAIIRRWYWAVAAVVLALVGFFAFYNFDDNQPKLDAKSEGKNETAIKPSTPEKPIMAEKSTTPQASSIQPKPTLLAQADIQQTSIEETNYQEDSVEELPTLPVEDNTGIIAEAEPMQQKQTFLPDVIEPTATGSSSESSETWTVGLVASNGLFLASNSMTQAPLYDADPGDFTSSDKTPSYTPADVTSKHHIPLRLGLSLQYRLNNRLALLSGINYTYLESEFSIPRYNYSYNQRLSYLGIPFGISWKIWSTNHFNIYLAGGTMIEKCISVEVSDGKISSKPWQWSVNASAGAEYNFTRQFGIYLEPSLGYYFNDGTKLEHYYKEHPLAPSLQFGLRLHLK